MNLQDIIVYAIRSLKTTSLRSYLTIIGIVIGVIAVVVIISISEGVQRDINSQLSAFGTDKMFVVPSIAGSGGRGFSGGSPLQGATLGKLFQRDVDSVSSIAGIKSVGRVVYGRSSLAFRGKELTATIYGTDSIFFEQWRDYLTLESGRFFSDNEKRVVVLGYSAAKDTFGKDELSVGSVFQINGKDYRVVGVLKKIGTSLSAADDSSIYIPYEDGREEFVNQLSKNEVQMIGIQLADGYQSSDLQGIIEQKIASNHKLKVDDADFMVISSDYINQTIGSLLGTLSLFLLFITLIATFVGGIGIMNTMFMGVLERVREIGILKAVGATEFDILALFIAESSIIGFIGGIIGLVVGLAILYVAGQFGVPFWVRLRIFAFAFFFSTFVGMIAGLIPARQAAKMDPVDALRYE
ncbi:MacB-like periplasmic core domain protein [Candidatus Bilamarchaeum dharawalense]|uniref:MacB-like periplasmic core domain protein n=1 Tax=Candidatus Bilamarchaeum dharawalense TaxID=2885759 RepID=A0A5E4LQL9_9ARCH|nr:MacB-like periplasmic core domain protein [Candidatus Bilamarchaeum dharawalense]